MKVLFWNARVGRRPKSVVRSLRRLVRRKAPGAIVLVEARDYVAALRAEFRSEYRLRVSRDVVLLVRRDLKVGEVEHLDHLTPWRGPKAGIEHAGRGHLAATIDGVRFVFVHMTPGGPSGGIVTRGANRPSYDADRTLIRAAFRGAEIAVCLGDQNATIPEVWPFAARLGADVVETGSKVDHAFAKGVAVTGRRLRRRYGSDHFPVLYRVHA